MDKKGEVAFLTIMFTFFRFTVLLIVALSLVFFTRQFMKVSLNVDDVETEIFAQSAISSPNGISYTDDGRVYPGMVDADDFRNVAASGERLEKAMHYEENRFIAAEFALYRDGGLYLDPVYYNKQFYNAWEQLGRTLFTGKGGATVFEKYYKVLIVDKDNIEEGVMKITIAMPNS